MFAAPLSQSLPDEVQQALAICHPVLSDYQYRTLAAITELATFDAFVGDIADEILCQLRDTHGHNGPVQVSFQTTDRVTHCLRIGVNRIIRRSSSWPGFKPQAKFPRRPASKGLS